MGFFHCSLPSVEYMECDIGQTEFTPPGCVSLSNVTEPFLGMCFAASCRCQKHLMFPEGAFWVWAVCTLGEVA